MGVFFAVSNAETSPAASASEPVSAESAVPPAAESPSTGAVIQVEPQTAPVVETTASDSTAITQELPVEKTATQTAPAISQTPASPVANASSSEEKKPDAEKRQDSETPTGLGVTLAVGSAGIQLGMVKSFGEYFHSPIPLNAKLSFSFIKMNQNFDYEMSDQSMGFSTSERLSHLDLTLDIHPFKRFLRLSLGAAVNFNRITMDIKSNQSTNIGAVSVPAEEIGEIRSTIDFNPVTLYMGLGGGNIVSNRVSFFFDLGAYYQGSPNVSMEAEGLLEPSAENAPVIQKVFEKYEITHWWPVLNLGVGVKMF
jgi:hypothetical protein